MLILTRSTGEKIHIGDNIKVTVWKMQGGQIKVGIEAPKTINIVRDEIAGTPKPIRREGKVSEYKNPHITFKKRAITGPC